MKTIERLEGLNKAISEQSVALIKRLLEEELELHSQVEIINSILEGLRKVKSRIISRFNGPY